MNNKYKIPILLYHFRSQSGFSVIELLVVVAILGVLGALTVTGMYFELHRERAYAAANEVAGWLAAVQRSAERGKSCRVVFDNAIAADADANTQIATGQVVDAASAITDPNQCKANEPLFITAASRTPNAGFRVEVNPVTSFVFTPRGTVFNEASASGDFNGTIQISINARAGNDPVRPMRCVEVVPPMGTIRILQSNSTSGRC